MVNKTQSHNLNIKHTCVSLSSGTSSRLFISLPRTDQPNQCQVCTLTAWHLPPPHHSVLFPFKDKYFHGTPLFILFPPNSFWYVTKICPVFSVSVSVWSDIYCNIPRMSLQCFFFFFYNLSTLYVSKWFNESGLKRYWELKNWSEKFLPSTMQNIMGSTTTYTIFSLRGKSVHDLLFIPCFFLSIFVVLCSPICICYLFFGSHLCTLSHTQDIF